MTIYESTLTDANLKYGHIYITPFIDRLPADVFGGSRRDQPPAKLIELEHAGFRVETYVPSTEEGGPRNFFQARSFVRDFFDETNATAGDVVLFEEVAPYRLRLSLRPARVPGTTEAFGSVHPSSRRLASAAEYASYFSASLTEKEALLLKAHAMGGEMSMGDLAPFAGFESFPPVNSTYGHLGRKLAETFNLTTPTRSNGTFIRFAVLAAWSDRQPSPDWEENQADPRADLFRSYLHEEVLIGLHDAGILSSDELTSALDARTLAVQRLTSQNTLAGERVYIANFGRSNWAWQACHDRSAIATMIDTDCFTLWRAGNREGFIAGAMEGRTVAGLPPTRSVASRWFNLMTAIAETSGEIWIHREKDQLWWTRSLPQAPVFDRQFEPLPDKRDVVVCFKPCEPWRNTSLAGNALRWKALHPKAREFLFTEGTLQRLSIDNAAYAMALIEGRSLNAWHNLPGWKEKAEKKEPVTTFTPRQRAVARMAMTAKGTVAGANGQIVQKQVKNKDLLIPDRELEAYIDDLIEAQEALCALSGLALHFDGAEVDKQRLASLDRIDSSRHYEKGNLQVVCRFINIWKSDMPDPEFRRLMALAQGAQSL